MKIVIAIDSFKGSLSSMQAGIAVKEGIMRCNAQAEVVLKPIADGGEGTTNAIIDGVGGKKIRLSVTDPMGNPVVAYYGIMPDGKTAIMEMAEASGLTLVPKDRKDPYSATTLGVGEMISDALLRGVTEIIMGLGGSATNDGGTGMLQALGYQFLDKSGKVLGTGAKILGSIDKIDFSGKNQKLMDCSFKVACDVTNPLYGYNGATYVFGKQKGVLDSQVKELDESMKHFAKVSAEQLKADASKVPGAGAAGGLGFALKAYLNAELVPGVDLILDAIGIEQDIKDADIVVTGEGHLDSQTIMGKAPIGVAKLAKKYGKKVIAFAGAVSKEARMCNEYGIDAYFPILREVTTLGEAIDTETAANNLSDTAEQVFRLL